MPDITIDSRLKECRGTLEITMNFNRLIDVIDTLTTRIEALENQSE